MLLACATTFSTKHSISLEDLANPLEKFQVGHIGLHEFCLVRTDAKLVRVRSLSCVSGPDQPRIDQ